MKGVGARAGNVSGGGRDGRAGTRYVVCATKTRRRKGKEAGASGTLAGGET
jgi:hypothetical protein